MKTLMYAFILLVTGILILAGCSPAGGESSTGEPAMIPTPASQEVKAFIWQTDGFCGYRMLRPQYWQTSTSECRYYIYQHSADDRLELRVVNYQVMAQQMAGGTIAQYEAFKLDSSLEGWAASVERDWSSLGVEFALLETLPQAKIYYLEKPEPLELIALVIDQDQPLGISLAGYGSYTDVPGFKNGGLKSDFIYMVANLHAAAYDPENIEPPIE